MVHGNAADGPTHGRPRRYVEGARVDVQGAGVRRPVVCEVCDVRVPVARPVGRAAFEVTPAATATHPRAAEAASAAARDGARAALQKASRMGLGSQSPVNPPTTRTLCSHPSTGCSAGRYPFRSKVFTGHWPRGAPSMPAPSLLHTDDGPTLHQWRYTTPSKRAAAEGVLAPTPRRVVLTQGRAKAHPAWAAGRFPPSRPPAARYSRQHPMAHPPGTQPTPTGAPRAPAGVARGCHSPPPARRPPAGRARQWLPPQRRCRRGTSRGGPSRRAPPFPPPRAPDRPTGRGRCPDQRLAGCRPTRPRRAGVRRRAAGVAGPRGRAHASIEEFPTNGSRHARRQKANAAPERARLDGEAPADAPLGGGSTAPPTSSRRRQQRAPRPRQPRCVRGRAAAHPRQPAPPSRPRQGGRCRPAPPRPPQN